MKRPGGRACYIGLLLCQMGVLAYQFNVAWLILTWTDIDIDPETMRPHRLFQLDRWADLILIALDLTFSTAALVGLVRRRRWALLAGILGPLHAAAVLLSNATESGEALFSELCEATAAFAVVTLGIVYPLWLLRRDGWKRSGCFQIESSRILTR